MAGSKAVPEKRKKRRMRQSGTEKSTLVERIAKELRERIIDGTFGAGEHLHQASLAKKMGVSSIPFREALRMLENEGFVEMVPFKGYEVKRLSLEEFAERVKIAFVLETLAVELALPTLTEGDLERAGKMAEGLYPVTSIDSWYSHLSELFRILFGARNRPILFRMIMRNRMAARRYTEIAARESIRDPIWAKQWVSGYFPRLVELIRGRDLEAVKRLHQRRMQDAMDFLLPRLAQCGEASGRPRTSLRRLKGPRSARGAPRKGPSQKKR
jgi:DNA-binding GntR family transcriptional regulator